MIEPKVLCSECGFPAADHPCPRGPLVPAPGSVAIVQLQEMADQMEKCIKTNRHSNGERITAHTMSEIRGKRDAYNHAISIVLQNDQALP